MTNPIIKSTLDAVYKAAHQGAILVDRSALGLLKFTGETRLDLINRMSTQKVDTLAKGQGAATVFTTDIGRIIDRAILYAADEAVYCLTSENNGDNIARYLLRFVFFMDDFHVEDLSDETAVFGVYGPNSRSHLEEILGSFDNLGLHHWSQFELSGMDVYLHRTDAVADDGYYVMAHSDHRGELLDRLMSTGLVLADEKAFDYLRIESGLPRFGFELTGDYIPLETGLWSDVSFNKGCYTGQEIIARMESRGRLAKKMVNMRLDRFVKRGSELRAGGKSAGQITSIADGPAGVVALGYVKTSILEEGTPISAGNQLVNIAES